MPTLQSLEINKIGTRLRSLDIVRGLVMVLMAIDHVRVYSGIPAGGQPPGIFFTRWVTHFCAPVFVFLAGSSAFLYGNKLGDKKKLIRFLATRGILLVLLELTVIRFAWTFNFDYSQFTLAGVIWMLGCCMLLLSLLVRLKPVTVGIIGLFIIFFQQVFQFLPKVLPQSVQEYVGWFWEFIYPSGLKSLPGITILYVLVPWIGVMAAGFGFGPIFLLEPARRRRICLWIGLSAIGLFLSVGSYSIFQKPVVPDTPPFIFRLLNQNKYPASALYLLMTLGPMFCILPWAERLQGWGSKTLSLFGRVPMFYYLLHIPLIHSLALLVNFIREGSFHQDWYGTAPFTQIPKEDRWGLPLLYLIFLVVELILYLACRAFARYKDNHPTKAWLKYI